MEQKKEIPKAREAQPASQPSSKRFQILQTTLKDKFEIKKDVNRWLNTIIRLTLKNRIIPIGRLEETYNFAIPKEMRESYRNQINRLLIIKGHLQRAQKTIKGIHNTVLISKDGLNFHFQADNGLKERFLANPLGLFKILETHYRQMVLENIFTHERINYKQKGNDQYPTLMVHEYTVVKRNTIKKIVFLAGKKHSITELRTFKKQADSLEDYHKVQKELFTRNGHRFKIFYRLSREGKQTHNKICKAEEFNKNGKLVKTVEFKKNNYIYTRYDSSGRIDFKMTRTLNAEVISNDIEFDFIHRNSYSQLAKESSNATTAKKETIQFYYHTKNGIYGLNSFVKEKTKHKNLTPNEYLKKFKATINTPEKVHLYERFYQNEYFNKIPYSLFIRMRKYCKEVCGIDKKEKEFKNKYGFSVVTEYLKRLKSNKRLVNFLQNTNKIFGYPPHTVDLHELPLNKIAQTLESIDEAYSKYPPDFIKKLNIGSVYLLKIGGKAIAGVAITDIPIIKGLILNGDKSTSHHELYHHIDKVGRLKMTSHQWGTQIYGKRYKNKYIGYKKTLPAKNKPRPEGFSRYYGKSNPAEDKATIAEKLFSRYDYNAIIQIAQTDKILAKKIRLIKDSYYTASNGKIDDIFWKAISEGKEINANWWSKRPPCQKIPHLEKRMVEESQINLRILRRLPYY